MNVIKNAAILGIFIVLCSLVYGEIYENNEARLEITPTESWSIKDTAGYYNFLQQVLLTNKLAQDHYLYMGICLDNKLNESKVYLNKESEYYDPVNDSYYTYTEWDKLQGNYYYLESYNKPYCYYISGTIKSNQTRRLALKSKTIYADFKYDYLLWKCQDDELCSPLGDNALKLWVLDPSMNSTIWSQVRHYKFNSTKRLEDTGLDSVNLTASGSPTIVAIGKIGNATYYDDVGDYDNMGVIGYDSADDFTFSFWYKRVADATGYAKIVDNYITNALFRIHFYMDNNNKIIFYLSDNSGNTGSITASATQTQNVWYHVIGTYAGATGGKAMRLYINTGSSGTNTTYPGTTDPETDPLKITSGAASHTMQIDDFRIFNRVINNSEIKWIYNNSAGTEEYYPGADSPQITEAPGSILNWFNTSGFPNNDTINGTLECNNCELLLWNLTNLDTVNYCDGINATNSTNIYCDILMPFTLYNLSVTGVNNISGVINKTNASFYLHTEYTLDTNAPYANVTSIPSDQSAEIFFFMNEGSDMIFNYSLIENESILLNFTGNLTTYIVNLTPLLNDTRYNFSYYLNDSYNNAMMYYDNFTTLSFIPDLNLTVYSNFTMDEQLSVPINPNTLEGVLLLFLYFFIFVFLSIISILTRIPAIEVLVGVFGVGYGLILALNVSILAGIAIIFAGISMMIRGLALT